MDDQIGEFITLFGKVSEETGLTRDQLVTSLGTGLSIPAEAFATERSPLETVVAFLRAKGYRNTRIADLLKRSQKTVSQAKTESLVPDEGSVYVPIAIFANRELSILESLVCYLHLEKGLRFSEIGRLIGKDQRSLWTVFDRARKKDTYIYSTKYIHTQICEQSVDSELFSELKKKYEELRGRGFDEAQIRSVLSQEILVNTSVFCEGLAPLEALVSHLRSTGIANKRIAVLLDRSEKTISQAVRPIEHMSPDSAYSIPLSTFRDRKLSVLEWAVTYLKEESGLRYSEIGRLLGRDDRLIWTVYSRSRKKRGDADG